MVVRSLPGTIIKDFFNEIGKLGLEAEDYEGADAFDVLIRFVQVGFKNLSAAAKLSKLEASASGDKAIHMRNLEGGNDTLETANDSGNGSCVTVHFHQSNPDRPKKAKSKAHPWFSDKFTVFTAHRIVKESYEDASYILQKLNIHGFDFLCFMIGVTTST